MRYWKPEFTQLCIFFSIILPKWNVRFFPLYQHENFWKSKGLSLQNVFDSHVTTLHPLMLASSTHHLHLNKPKVTLWIRSMSSWPVKLSLVTKKFHMLWAQQFSNAIPAEPSKSLNQQPRTFCSSWWGRSLANSIQWCNAHPNKKGQCFWRCKKWQDRCSPPATGEHLFKNKHAIQPYPFSISRLIQLMQAEALLCMFQKVSMTSTLMHRWNTWEVFSHYIYQHVLVTMNKNNYPTVVSLFINLVRPFFHLRQYYGLHNVHFLLEFFRCKICITFKLVFVPAHFIFRSFLTFKAVIKGCGP